MTDIPIDVVETATTLTRRARDAVDDTEANAYRERRDALLDAHGFNARVRRDRDGNVLVLYPADWLDDTGTVDVAGLNDVDRAVEIRLDGTGVDADWETIAAHNEAVAAAIRDRHGDVHGDNADAFATYMSNHHAKRITAATDKNVEDFLSEYYLKNTWPSEEQVVVVEQTLAYLNEHTKNVNVDA